MNLQPADVARLAEALPAQAEPAAAMATHEASLLHGATSTGEAGRRTLSVRVGLWLDEGGRVRRARWRAMEDPALRELAEAACSLLEGGFDPAKLDGDSLLGVRAAPHGHADRADLVAAAIQAAVSAAGCRT